MEIPRRAARRETPAARGGVLKKQQWQDFYPLVRYWSLLDEDLDDEFPITPIMRKLWAQHFS